VRPTPSKLTVYKTKPFDRFARKARLSDADLWNAAELANQGLIDADLGGGVIKLRIARAGEGKSGGSRTIIAFRKDDRAIYMFGFEKKDRANIDQSDLEALRKLARTFLGYTAVDFARDIRAGELAIVVESENKNASEISQ
jgi:hypothetical protein